MWATIIKMIIFDEGITLCRITRSRPSKNPGHRLLMEANTCACSLITTVRILEPFWGVQKVF